MAMRGENVRFWTPVLLLCVFAGYTSFKLFRAHVVQSASEPRYGFEREVASARGAIYDSTGDPATGRRFPLVKSTPCWEFRLDPVAMTNAPKRTKGPKPRTTQAMARTISSLLGLDYAKVLSMAGDFRHRYQFLAVSDSQRARDVLCDPRYVRGVIALEAHDRRYFEGTRFAHVLGGVNRENDGSCGIEQKFNSLLKGVPGRIRGKRDGTGREIVEKRVEMTPPVPGADIYLTVDRHIQYEVETALADGIERFAASSGWCVVLGAEDARVLALASFPSFDPSRAGKAVQNELLNRVTAFTYEPGSVMKVITAAGAIEAGLVTPETKYSTDRGEKNASGDAKYYKLPGDGSHVWEPRMTVSDAIAHSSNIVIGKLAWDMGPTALCGWMRRFGFGERTGIELPGEECGILRSPEKWDLATRSRAGIGQGISVTAIQLASAYQAIANDGVRVPPRIVEKILGADGAELPLAARKPPERVVSSATARKVRRMMLGVAAPGGTARRAALKGYSIAGKTGTAQKVVGGKYAPGLYRATFCGIVPSGVVRRDPADAEPAKPEVVILVGLDFDEKRLYHQGGNSSGPVFKRIAMAAMRYLEVPPDRPDEAIDAEDGEFERMADERARKAAGEGAER